MGPIITPWEHPARRQAITHRRRRRARHDRRLNARNEQTRAWMRTIISATWEAEGLH